MVVRDSLGSIQWCTMKKIDNIKSLLHAKMKVILFGVEEASSNLFLSILVENDSLLAIREVEKIKRSYYEWEGISVDIRNRARLSILCVQTYQEINKLFSTQHS